MNKFRFYIEVKNSNGEFYRHTNGRMALYFIEEEFILEDDELKIIEICCREKVEKFLAIAKEGSTVSMTISKIEEVKRGYSAKYSFRSGEDKLIRHQ